MKGTLQSIVLSLDISQLTDVPTEEKSFYLKKKREKINEQFFRICKFLLFCYFPCSFNLLLVFASASYNAVNYGSNGGAGGRFQNNKVCP